MARLMLCPSCQTHVLPHEVGCPHCGAELKTTAAPRSSVVLLGLALAACPAGDDGDTAADTTMTPTTTAPTTTSPTTSTSGEPTSTTTDDTISGSGDVEYGAPDTFDTSDTQVDTTTTSGDADTSTGSTGSTGSSGTGDGTTTGLDSAGEPEYGVPESG